MGSTITHVFFFCKFCFIFCKLCMGFGEILPVPYCVPSEYTFIELYGLSFYDCTQQCNRRRQCLSISYIRFELFCGLNNVSLARHLYDRTGISQHLRCKGYNVRNKVFGNDCESKGLTCQPHEQCITDNYGLHARCVASHCGPVPKLEIATIEKIYDRSVGSNIRYACNSFLKQHGKTKAICTNNGTWMTSLTCRDLCPLRYVRIHNYCLLFSVNQANYTYAKILCKRTGGHLLTNIHEEKNILVKQYLQETHINPQTCYIIDAIRTPEGYIWGSSERGLIYSDWGNNEPSNSANDVVVCMYKDDHYHWHDSVQNDWNFICEYD